jgi:hypothetical protein
MDYELLTRPLTAAQIRRQMDADGVVEGVVAIELDDVIDNDRDRVVELLSELLVDNTALEDIEYELLGNDGDMLHLHVRGDASNLVEDEEEDEDPDEDEEDDY